MPTAGPAYTPALWSSFLSAELSASAALTGLLFVAVSINLSKILQFRHLTARVAKVLVILVGVLLVSTLCLVPGQSNHALGCELVLAGLLVSSVTSFLQWRTGQRNAYMTARQKTVFVALALGATFPPLCCGASLLYGHGGGLYWLVPGVVISFLAALIDVWVLLIEILR